MGTGAMGPETDTGTKVRNGGPAFPQAVARGADGGINFSSDVEEGEHMSSRRYIAARAMQSIIALNFLHALASQLQRAEGMDAEAAMSAAREQLARLSYGIADAMLKYESEHG